MSGSGGSRPGKRVRVALGGLAAAGLLAFVALWWGLGGQAGDGLSLRDWRRLSTSSVPAEAAALAAALSIPDSTFANAVPAAQQGGQPAAESAGESAGDPAGEPVGELPPPPVQDARPALPPLDPEIRQSQVAEYAARRAKTVVELQQYRVTESIGAAGSGRVTLVNLNPLVNRWYLVAMGGDASGASWYHLENLFPGRQSLTLDENVPDGLVIATRLTRLPCALWGSRADTRLDEIARTQNGYAYLCDGRVAARLRTTGQKSRMESVTDFLRDRLPGGEQITVFVRQNFFQDAYLQSSPLQVGPMAAAPGTAAGPPPARMDPRMTGSTVAPAGLGLPLEGGAELLDAGRWYGLRGSGGAYVSAIRPDAVAPYEVPTLMLRMGPLDEVETRALAYLVAFDLARFDLAYAIGTDHPRLGWSDRFAENLRPAGLPGPDGISGPEPLVPTGMVPPHLLPQVAAAFTGGFKRTHGAFRYGELAQVNLGSHYGIVESGVVYSKLQPGLSTLLVTVDGRVDMKTWTSDDDSMLERVAFARQNGVPLVQTGDSGVPEPGPDLARFGAGNWSGSQDGRYRTLRASACLIESGANRYLVYGYFSAATPSAMAKVLLAYGCRHAMLLDMNALEHTYMASYTQAGGNLGVSHLIDGMRVLDRQVEGVTLPRFLAFADNRDFFYLLRKPEPEVDRAN